MTTDNFQAPPCKSDAINIFTHSDHLRVASLVARPIRKLGTPTRKMIVHHFQNHFGLISASEHVRAAWIVRFLFRCPFRKDGTQTLPRDMGSTESYAHYKMAFFKLRYYATILVFVQLLATLGLKKMGPPLFS
ncbi:hypothetical protein CDAR_475461 [Caerostris darwini]|uniref:Uncharacterized protein n=1 Tax=Caerostris darwini TaxID=1538125 RepID=A0AAV4PBS0_9ARAC|nr:hypothetical protein CDAR_475461 [Caerostris darwini]